MKKDLDDGWMTEIPNRSAFRMIPFPLWPLGAGPIGPFAAFQSSSLNLRAEAEVAGNGALLVASIDDVGL